MLIEIDRELLRATIVVVEGFIAMVEDAGGENWTSYCHAKETLEALELLNQPDERRA